MDQDIQKTQGSMKRRSSKRRIFIFAAFLVVGFLALIWGLDVYVGLASNGRLYTAIDEVPPRSAALVLGCGKYTQGRPNLYYRYRIEAAAKLWYAGKINAILVSGDNSRKNYDEPSEMKADLVKKGIPGEYITIDYAGFRTLDSIIRAKQIFGLDEYIIVSQLFHCQRAMYLANAKGQSTIGYCATDIGGSAGVKVRLRETLARVNAVMDIVISKNPKFLGPKEQIYYRDSHN